MPKVTELTIPCENRPGTLSHIATVLGKAKVNIVGFLITSREKKSFVKLIVDNVEAAKEALYIAELPYFESTVLHARLPNVPGALGRFAEKLAAKKINIISGYQTIDKDSKKASIVLEVSNLDRALRLSTSTPSDRLDY